MALDNKNETMDATSNFLYKNTLSLIGEFIDTWEDNINFTQNPIGVNILFSEDNYAYLVGNNYFPGSSTVKLSKIRLPFSREDVNVFKYYFICEYPSMFIGCDDSCFEITISKSEFSSLLSSIKKEIEAIEE